ncbi:MAG: NADH-quinone oxidoreductase subunit L [Candidatus Eremiobacter antarcticus]|nr:NADH-quinone oxidoreductase subunit L [Candidatus Eremiobacteraeota bacterium]MBC5807041.1 NADH-quinone oxidoreductase subunit L [Candidatus Eremiobacteraeota bacterium]PZR62829.1 MAG: NADH-quinone oxidoreductase subunit L [Candidatus Eremiobacter sp. RRmetagenome_bin22]
MSGTLTTVPFTILFLPLFGTIVIAFVCPRFHRVAAAIIANLAIFGSFLLTVILALTVWRLPPAAQAFTVKYPPAWAAHPQFWAHIPPLTISFELRIDPLALVWMLIVTGVGFLIHLYSIGYMAESKNYRTFFAYMNLFVFTMLVLVMAGNFLWLLVGWGGVGLASYLLIGFDTDRPAAVAAARKALILNVIGDVGIMLALFLMYAHFGSLSYKEVFANVTSAGPAALNWIGIWLLLGAVAKSAQLPLQTWLPDAMEGPTPVSALIHAATMVTAGVYLIARAHPIYDHAPLAAQTVAIVGCATALFAATIGCVQYDIKRVLAYSTMSQIGYMVLAVGVGAYAAGTFHFVTHAFFKALLFMAAGIVIHNLSGEQDTRKMGGLAKRMPLAFSTFLAGTLAITGIFPFAGFFSKDAILDQLLRLHHPALWFFATLTALLTAFYMFRLVFLTFFSGAYRGEHEPHAARSGTMALPAVLLAVLSLVGGWLVLPGHDAVTSALASTFADRSTLESMADFNWPLSLGTLALAVVGFLAAYALYERAPQMRERLRTTLRPVRALLMNAYYFDTIYHWLFEVPAYTVASDFARYVDPEGIAGVTTGLARTTVHLGDTMRGWETGYLRRYGLSMLVGVVLILAYYLYVAHQGAALGAR